MLRPSTTGNQLALVLSRAIALVGRARIASLVDLPRRHASVSVGPLPSHPRALVNASPWTSASSSVLLVPIAHAPLSMMARWNRSLLAGDSRCRHVLMPPADSPNSVTLPGSPPKALMFAFTHPSAA